MSTELIFSPSDFVAVFNQTIEYAYPGVVIEGELANFKVSRGRWVYFDIKDETASLAFFGNVYQLPGPLQDGLKLRVSGRPRLHPRFGFSIVFETIQPVGEGSIKKAADLLRAKLAAEGLFAPERKRPLPPLPRRIGLITAAGSAASADFLKILGQRWGGVEVMLADVLVQGQEAALQIVAALDYFEQLSPLPDVLVLTRGGGSADDLAVFNDERVVRAVAGSRMPTLVAIGHETDESLAELAADQRGATPSNAAQIVVPDRRQLLTQLATQAQALKNLTTSLYSNELSGLQDRQKNIGQKVQALLNNEKQRLLANRRLSVLFDPLAALRRGYAIITKGQSYISSVKQISAGDQLNLRLADGTLKATAGER